MEDRMSAKTLKRLERAAMRWYRSWYKGTSFREIGNADDALQRACAAHANAQRKGAKRKKK
jgi:hypothetical protein